MKREISESEAVALAILANEPVIITGTLGGGGITIHTLPHGFIEVDGVIHRVVIQS